jgi:hypothetical protein
LIGYTVASFKRNLRTLRTLGLISYDGDLLYLHKEIDEEAASRLMSKPLGQKQEGQSAKKPAPAPGKTIAVDVAAMPKTTKQIPTADRWAMIAKAWDANKPEVYSLFGSKAEGVKIAIGAHMKRLGLATDAYDDFIGGVLRGCAKDDWWSTCTGQTPKGVFGFGDQLEDSKYSRVEQLYRSGLQEAKVQVEKAESRRSQDAALREFDEREERIRLNNEACLARHEIEDPLVAEAWESATPAGWPKAVDEKRPYDLIQSVDALNKLLRHFGLEPQDYVTFLERAIGRYRGIPVTLIQFTGGLKTSGPFMDRCPAYESYTHWSQANNLNK